MTQLTQEYIKSLFNYKDGNLYWKISLNQRIKIDNKAGTLKNIGYYSVKINGKQYLNHRLIFLYHNGYLPKYVDHIDRNKSNNKIENLRESTQSENMMNRKSNKNTSSIYKGVHWNNRAKKWIAKIYINGKEIYLGSFINEKDGAQIYNKIAMKYFGKYAKLNEII